MTTCIGLANDLAGETSPTRVRSICADLIELSAGKIPDILRNFDRFYAAKLPRSSNRYRMRAVLFVALLQIDRTIEIRSFDKLTPRGRLVSTGWQRCRWHAQDAQLAWIII